MKLFILIFIYICLSIVHGEICHGIFNESISGQCAFAKECQGTLLAGESCEIRPCCVNRTVVPTSSSCLNQTIFMTIYNSSRGAYLAKVLSNGINKAGICNNCQAKAAFLAIAATMSENFEKDEATGNDAFFAADDRLYGNTQAGDGSRFRRRGFFGLRGRTMYERLQILMPQSQMISNPEQAAIIEKSIEIAVQLWKNPTLQGASALTPYADGTFYSFSKLWYILTGEIEQLPDAAKQYSKFLRLLQCGGDLYPGQGPVCQYNETHTGFCTPNCIKGLEDAGEFCGCSGDKGFQCPDGPPHIRCCLDSCSQELKLDLGIVIDASGSISRSNYELQRTFTKNLLRRVNIGENKTHVGIINFSTSNQIVTMLNTDYDLDAKLRRMDIAIYFGQNTNTAQALERTNEIFSYENGLRQPEEGAPQVIFVITDGASANERATIQAAAKLKAKSIHIVSIGIGTNLRYSELYAMCTPPANENYFAITNYAALEQKLNQFTSKACSEPLVIPANTTVTGEVTQGKYKFLKLEIIVIGNKIMIKIKLFNGKVNLFYSFTSRNPKDPNDFEDYPNSQTTSLLSSSTRFTDISQQKLRIRKENDDLVTLVIDKPENDVKFVYVGVKGVEQESKFEVNLEDCALVDCRSMASSMTKKVNVILMLISILISMEVAQ